MSRIKMLWFSLIIGALLGITLCLVAYFVKDGTDLAKNIEIVITHLVSVPAFISIKLNSPEKLMPILTIIYWALISWFLCAVWTMQLRFKYALLIVLVVLLGALHRYCLSLLESELKPLFIMLESLFKGTYKIVK